MVSKNTNCKDVEPLESMCSKQQEQMGKATASEKGKLSGTINSAEPFQPA